jgi:hypothetical protein
MATLITTKNGYVTVVLDTATNDKVITAGNYSNSPNTRSMHDSATGANYQVPVGRKLIITSITATFAGEDNASGTELYLYNSNSADSATGTLILNDMKVEPMSSNYPLHFTIPFYCEIPAGNYVNVAEVSGGRLWAGLSGVETDV